MDATSGNARGGDANALDPVRLSTGGLPPIRAQNTLPRFKNVLEI